MHKKEGDLMKLQTFLVRYGVLISLDFVAFM